MFIVLLRYTDKAKADEFKADHYAWIERGFADGVFLLLGPVRPEVGGCILVHNTTMAELRDRVDADPYVVGSVVTPEILEIDPKMADDRLAFLVA